MTNQTGDSCGRSVASGNARLSCAKCSGDLAPLATCVKCLALVCERCWASVVFYGSWTCVKVKECVLCAAEGNLTS